MGKILILNGSPRAPRSNSKRYAELFAAHCAAPTEYVNLAPKGHEALRDRMEEVSDLLLVFPLYADALPVGLVELLKFLEAHPPVARPTVSVLINCGFIEPEQNDIAVEMLQLFCQRQGYPFGSVLRLGGGEAILDTPLRFIAERKIAQLARAVAQGRPRSLHASMPIGKRLFIAASTRYWIRYGARYGVTREQMQTPLIEGE